jgi:serine/threonine protein phosphatase 1
MSSTYVIPDLHGRRDLLDAALARIAAHAAGAFGTIVMLGDYVDKGPDSSGVVARLRGGVGAAWRFVALKGNHDAMMVDALRDPATLAFWLSKGGDAALSSYGGDVTAVPQADINWLDGLPLWHVDTHRIYVHAGVDPDIALHRQREATLLWKRYPKGDPEGFGDRHVVHGHDNDPAGPLLTAGRSNLDTLAWDTGRLVVGVFDDATPGGPVELIEIQGPPASN